MTRFLPAELTFKPFQELFKTKDTQFNDWTVPKSEKKPESQVMVDFFKSFDESLNPIKASETPEQRPTEPPPPPPGPPPTPILKYERSLRGYFDDPLNTDQAWKEVELWHFHYAKADVLNNVIGDTLEWRSVTEGLFNRLSLSHSTVIQTIYAKLKESK